MRTRHRILDDGTERAATLEEMAAGQGGLWRFGVPASTLLPWGRLRDAARIRPKVQQELISAASKCGADPYDWMGSIEPVPLERCIVQRRMTAASEWVDQAP